MIDPNKPAHIRAAEQPAQQKCDSDALVMIPRGLIGAACYAINKKRDAPKLIKELQRYTVGELSAPAQQPAQAFPIKWQMTLVAAIANKIEDGTLFESGFYSRKDLARFVRNVLEAAERQPQPLTQPEAQPEQRQPLTDELTDDLVAAMENLMAWQVKNVDRWHNSAYDHAHSVLEKYKAAHGIAEGAQ